MFDRPEVGKIVTVTTDWSDVVETSMPTTQINHGTQIKTGRIVKNNDWDDPASFNITTGIPHFPVANVPLHRVLDLVYSDGTEADTLTEASQPDYETWTVEGSKGDEYLVTRNGDAWSCECKGFGFNRKCRHITEKKTEVLERMK